MDIWIISSFYLFLITLLWRFMNRFCVEMFPILLDINLAMELLAHVVTLCLTVKLGYFLIVER